MQRTLVVLVACATPPPATETRRRPEPVACAASRTRTRAAIDAAGLGADSAVIAAQFDHCWSGWSIALDAICHVPAPSFDDTEATIDYGGRWIVMYEPRDGTPATYVHDVHIAGVPCIDAIAPANIASAGLTDVVHLDPPTLFDFDGDGVPELYLAGELLTFKRKVVSRYAPALKLTGVATTGIAALRDIDDDHRPDLFVVFSAAVPASVPKRVAHALPDGTFTESDAVAKRALLDQCPAASTLLVLRADQSIDVPESQARVACAALRGELGGDVERRLATLCAARSNECLDVERWANAMYLYGVGSQ